MRVRTPVVAGRFYSAARDALGQEVSGYLDSATLHSVEGPVRALIVPHAGYIASGVVAASAYKLLERYRGSIRGVVLTGPSHFFDAKGAVTDSNDCWQTPLGTVKLLKSGFPRVPEAHSEEHCLEVQLPFLQKTLGQTEILPLVIGRGDSHTIAEQLAPLLEDEGRLLIVSSDLSHYYDYDTARGVDQKSCEAISTLDLESMKRNGEACGKTPILALMEIARQRHWSCGFLDYRNSGDTMGDKGSVVGYAAFCFCG